MDGFSVAGNITLTVTYLVSTLNSINLKNLSRNHKNYILISCNTLMICICGAKLLFAPTLLASSMTWWLYCSPIILVLALQPSGRGFIKVIHAGLFIVTGAALGFTLRLVFTARESLWLIDYIWLLVAIACVFIHYSPSSKDEYLNQVD